MRQKAQNMSTALIHVRNNSGLMVMVLRQTHGCCLRVLDNLILNSWCFDWCTGQTSFVGIGTRQFGFVMSASLEMCIRNMEIWTFVSKNTKTHSFLYLMLYCPICKHKSFTSPVQFSSSVHLMLVQVWSESRLRLCAIVINAAQGFQRPGK